MRQCRRVILRAAQPLILSDGSTEGLRHRTLEYIPGNMLLGAMAYAWRELHPDCAVPDDDADFTALFLRGGVWWGHACPLVGERETVPIPRCYRYLKNYDGLPTAGDDDAGPAKIVNVLRLQSGEEADAAQEQIRRAAGDRLRRPDEAVKLKKCGDGFMIPDERCRPDQGKTVRTHAAIGPARTAREGYLFAYECLGAGTAFAARLYCEEEVAPALDALLAAVAGGEVTLRVGHARSAGYGRVTVTAGPPEPLPPVTPPAGEECCLYLLSGYVPMVPWLTPFRSLREDLAAYGWELLPERPSVAYRELNAFHGRRGLPRPMRIMLAPGSVLRCRRRSQDPGRELPPAFGGGVTEGYGRYLIDPEFLRDLIVSARAVPADPAPEAAGAAIMTLPQELRGLLRARALQRLIRDAAEDFVRGPRIRDFLDSQQGAARRITNAALGTMRGVIADREPAVWGAWFHDMLGKTAGEQWQRAEGRIPFRTAAAEPGDYRDLPEIVDELLREVTWEDLSDPQSPWCLASLPVLPDGPWLAREREFFLPAYRRQALLLLLKAWVLASRASGDKEGRG